ncbi:MAG: alkaline phosphatase family protein, partial [Acidobacteria bacterium]|nr:alkaline phosphatase family protein [Acidobacteriota bacterium]
DRHDYLPSVGAAMLLTVALWLARAAVADSRRRLLLEGAAVGLAAFICSAFYPACSQAALAYSQEQGITEKPGDPSAMAMFRLHPEWRQWECSLSAPCEQHCPEDVVAAHMEDYGMGRGFPHRVANATALLYTPYGNDLVEGMAERIVQAHSLGKNPRGQPDVLVVGFSSTDYFGHLYGPDSCETADGMKRLDATLARFLDFLTARVGSENLFVVVTADHGITPIPRVSLQRGVPAGRVDMSDRGRVAKRKVGDLPPLRQRMEFELGRLLGFKLDASTPLADALIRGYREPGLYLNRERIGAQALPLARAWLADYLMRVEGIQEIHSSDELSRGEGPESARLSFYPNRTGDLLVFLAPGWIEWDEDAGTSHGQPHDADARVPLLVWGAGVEPGEDGSQVDMARVAATLGATLGLDPRGLDDPSPLPLRGPPVSK